MAIKSRNETLFFLRAVPTPTDAAKNNVSSRCIVFISNELYKIVAVINLLQPRITSKKSIIKLNRQS